MIEHTLDRYLAASSPRHLSSQNIATMGCSNLLASITLVWTSYLLLAGSKNIEHVPAFKRSLSNYGYMTYDRCFRAKIPQNNDDDGNSYFHNGAYRYQSALYLAYRLCEDCDCSDGGTSYIMASEDVLQAQIAYTQGYCDTCSNQCARRRRSLKENGGGYEPDCGKCIDECSPLLFNFYEGYDETDYLYCQEAHASEDGVQYYSGPTCDNDGVLTIGLYYDGKTTFKTKAFGLQKRNKYSQPACPMICYHRGLHIQEGFQFVRIRREFRKKHFLFNERHMHFVQ